MMKFISVITNKLRALYAKIKGSDPAKPSENCYKAMIKDANNRIARMERNYLVLLKRLLEMDGVQLVTKSSNLNTKVIQTNNEEQKGLNERKPTIH